MWLYNCFSYKVVSVRVKLVCCIFESCVVSWWNFLLVNFSFRCRIFVEVLCFGKGVGESDVGGGS